MKKLISRGSKKMKQIILLILSFIILSGRSIAGSPQIDNITANLQERFESASVPEIKDLRVGSYISCISYDAFDRRDRFSYIENKFYFKKINKKIFESKTEEVIFSRYLLAKQGLVSYKTVDAAKTAITIKVEDDGTLLGEFVANSRANGSDLCWDSNCIKDESSIHQGYYLLEYLECL